MIAKDSLEQLRLELAVAGLDLGEDEIARVLPMWRDNLPRRAWLRAQAFTADEAPFAGHAPPVVPAAVEMAKPAPAKAAPFGDADGGPTDLDLGTLSGLLGARKISARELVQACLDRIARYDPILHTTACLMADAALDAARASDVRRAQGVALSALDGVPIGVKDCIPVAGASMTGGSLAYAGNVPALSSPCIESLQAAGVIVLAKQAMHELGAGPAIPDGPRGTGRNPYDLSRIPGGSSSGSAAAVAAGLCAGALGTDAAGSVRIPAAYCGLVGLKPTRGAIPLAGCLPLTWSLDTIGTLTRDVRGAALLFAHASASPAALELRDDAAREARLSAGVKGVKLGLLRRYYLDAPDVREDVRAATGEALRVFRKLGAEIVDVDVPSIDRNDVGYTTLLAESWTIHGALAMARPSKLSDWLRVQLHTAATFTADDLLRARRYQTRLLTESLAALAGVDALVHPGMAEPATPFGNSFITALTQPRSRFTRPWNVTGLPALALPCGVSREGLPLSLQLVGRPFDEAAILCIASAYERVTEWHRFRPDPAKWR